MCSTWEARLASLRAAIDEVALAAQSDPGEHVDVGELTARLASIWAMIAELDPGLAARLRGYCPDTNLEHPALGTAGLAAPRLPLAAFSSVNSLSEAASLLGPCQGLPGTAAHYSSAPTAGHS